LSAEARRWLGEEVATSGSLTDLVCAPLDRGWSTRWLMALLGSLALAFLGALAVGYSLIEGPGVWGNNTAVVWGFPIANYVWWIGIGNAGTLISSLLLLTRQNWRASINRFAEAMTLFAVAIAGIFPILHLGRPMYFYWLAPYPNTMDLWPQWRSALVWDFWAILCYLLFSVVFFYVGLLPDLATLRDRETLGRGWRKIYGVAALGWQGSAAQWQAHERLHRALAVIATPLVCSVHSIVGLDFAASLMPGWTEGIFPPFFVVGALFSGVAMVTLIALIIRRALGLEAIVTPAHFDAMAKIMLAASVVMGLSYGTEWFTSWWTGEASDARFLRFAFTGPYWPFTVGMILANVVIPQAFWFPAARRSPLALVAVSLAILVGMYLERINIIIDTLSIGYVPSFWKLYAPTLVDGAILAGTAGLFVALMLIASRFLPMVSIHESRRLVAEASR